MPRADPPPGPVALVHGPDAGGFLLGFSCSEGFFRGMAEALRGKQRGEPDHPFAVWREATIRGLLRRRRRAVARAGLHDLIASGKSQGNRAQTGKQQHAGCPPHARMPTGAPEQP